MIGTSDHSRTFLITSIPSKSGKPRSRRTGPALREIQTSCSKSAGIREFRAAAMGLALMSLPFCCRSFPAHSPAPSRHSPTYGKLPAFYPPPRRRRRRVDGVPGGVFCSLFTRDAGLPPKQIRLNRLKPNSSDSQAVFIYRHLRTEIRKAPDFFRNQVLLSGKSTAHGYNAPCFDGMVHCFMGSGLMRRDNRDRKDNIKSAYRTV